MDKFKKSLSLKKKKNLSTSETTKPNQWKEDEKKVREGCCSFQVKYLGCIEVFESRGINVCEEAVKALKNKKGGRNLWARMSLRRSRSQNKSHHHLAVLYVTGDALRVVDENSKGLIVDQTIEKVSFCAPDRNHEKGFAYICRDGTTRRWMCHGFLAIKESGERLSHAVGCAFAICLEKKQQREKEKVSVMYSDNGTSFTRMGSFKQTTMTERLVDPQSVIVAEPVPAKPLNNPYAVQRPHAPVDLLERQGSFRSFNKLADSSPFKRNISLRLNELPSNVERQNQFSFNEGLQQNSLISTIPENEETESPPPQSSPPPPPHHQPFPPPHPSNQQISSSSSSSPHQDLLSLVSPNSQPETGFVSTTKSNGQLPNHFSHNPSFVSPPPTNPSPFSPPSFNQGVSLNLTNPWADPPSNQNSEAEKWLNSTANKIDPFAGVPTVASKGPKAHQIPTSPLSYQHINKPSLFANDLFFNQPSSVTMSTHLNNQSALIMASVTNQQISTRTTPTTNLPQLLHQPITKITHNNYNNNNNNNNNKNNNNNNNNDNTHLSLQQQIEQQQILIQQLQQQLQIQEMQNKQNIPVNNNINKTNNSNNNNNFHSFGSDQQQVIRSSQQPQQ